MDFGTKFVMLLQDEEPQPGWSGLYDPWNGRRRQMFDLFDPSDLYYSREDSDYEDEELRPVQHQEEEQEGYDDDDDDEELLRSLSPLSPRSLSPPPFRRRSLISPATIMMAYYSIVDEEEKDEEEEEETALGSSSHARNPSSDFAPIPRPRIEVNIRDWVVGDPYVTGYQRVSLESMGIRRRRDQEDDDEDSPESRRRRFNFYPDTDEDFINWPIEVPTKLIPLIMKEL